VSWQKLDVRSQVMLRAGRPAAAAVRHVRSPLPLLPLLLLLLLGLLTPTRCGTAGAAVATAASAVQAAPINVGGDSGGIANDGAGQLVPVRPRGTVVIGTLDGHVFARDAWSGTLQWHFDSGGAMISASPIAKGSAGGSGGPDAADARAASSSGGGASARRPASQRYATEEEMSDAEDEDEDANAAAAVATSAATRDLSLRGHHEEELRGQQLRRAASGEAMVVPGLDGAMYLFDQAGPGPKVLSHRVKDLVHAARPVFLAGNKVLTTQKNTKVFPLDAHTGEPRTSPGDGEGKKQGGTLFVGRTEYMVRAMDGHTGKPDWDIFVGEYELFQEEVKRELESPSSKQERAERARTLPRFEVAPGTQPGDPEMLLAFANGPLGPGGSSQKPLWQEKLPSRALTLCGIVEDELLWRRDLFKMSDVGDAFHSAAGTPRPPGYHQGEGREALDAGRGAGLVRSANAASWMDVPPAVGLIMDVKIDQGGSVYTPGVAAEAAAAGLVSLETVAPAIGVDGGVPALPALPVEKTVAPNALPAPPLPSAPTAAGGDMLTAIAGPNDVPATLPPNGDVDDVVRGAGTCTVSTREVERGGGSCTIEIDVPDSHATDLGGGNSPIAWHSEWVHGAFTGDSPLVRKQTRQIVASDKQQMRVWQHQEQERQRQRRPPHPPQSGGQFFTAWEMQVIVLSLAICMSALVAAVLMKMHQDRAPATEVIASASPNRTPVLSAKPFESADVPGLLPTQLVRSLSANQVLEPRSRSNNESLPGVPAHRAPSPMELGGSIRDSIATAGLEAALSTSVADTGVSPSASVSTDGTDSAGKREGSGDHESEAARMLRGNVQRRHTMDETVAAGSTGSSTTVLQSESTRPQRSSTDPSLEQQQQQQSQSGQQRERGVSVPVLPQSPPKSAPLGLSFAKDRFKNEFERLEMLGRGGFGSVFKCKNRLDGRMYAVKEVRISSAKQYADRLRKVLREVKILAQLEHRNVVRYYGAWLEQIDPSIGSGKGGAGSTAAESSSQGEDGSTEWGGSESGIDGTTAGFCRDVGVTEGDSFSSLGEGSRSALGQPSLGFEWERDDLTEVSGGFEWDRADDNALIYVEDDEDDSESGDDEELTIGRDCLSTESQSTGSPCTPGATTTPQSVATVGGSEAELDARMPLDTSIAPSGSTPPSTASSGSGNPLGMARVSRRPAGRQRGRRRHAPLKFDQCLFIQMEYCAEKTLREYLDTPGRTIELEEVLDQILGVCKGLRYIHERNMVHRDVKPSNIFVACDESDGVGGDKTLKLGDFGLARNESAESGGGAAAATDGGEDASPTKQLLRRRRDVEASAGDNTMGVGTELYASPEQSSGKSYDAKTDMFSLGMTMFELLHPPLIASKMERAKVLSNARRGILPEEVLRGAVGTGEEGGGEDGNMLSDVLGVLRKLLATEPRDRPCSKELQGELERKLERIRGISALTHRAQAFVVRVEAGVEQQMQLPSQVVAEIEEVWKEKSVLRFAMSTDKDKCVLELELERPKIMEDTEMLTNAISAAIQKLTGVSSVSVKVH
jgi:serine/threonine protein kinase